MKRLSTKPTVYLIDGSNFSMRGSDTGGRGRAGGAEDDFIQWLGEVSRAAALRASCFRVVFDGPCRRTGPAGPAITIYYSDSEPADELLVERGYFMQSQGVRAIIVTSDNGLRARAAAEGVKTLTCEAFSAMAAAELRKELR